MPTSDDETVRIGRHPGIVNARLIATASLGVAAAAGAPASIPFAALGGGDASWPLGILAVWLVFGGGLALGVSLAYSVIVFDPRTRTASLRRHALSLRRRTVSFDSITEARRSLSSGTNGAGYLVYRFVSADGATARVLVEGRPMKGLDAAGLRALARFVDGLPLHAPDAPTRAPGGNRGGDDHDSARSDRTLKERQELLAVSLTSGGGSSRVGRESLLTELSNLLAAAQSGDEGSVPAATSAEVISSTPQPAAPRSRRGIRGLIALFAEGRRERTWEQDDDEASAILVSSPTATVRRRRLFFRLILTGIALIVVVVALSVIIGEVGSPLPTALSEDILFSGMIGALVLTLGFYLGWCAAADAEVKHRRRLGRSWVVGRNVTDDDDRDLATPFMPAWAEPVSRLRAALGFLSCLVGSTAIIAAIIVFGSEDLSLGASAGILVSGVAVEAIGIALLIGVSRQRRSDAEELVLLGGRRLLPPAN